MGFKAWNIKKGLKRIWIIGTPFFIFLPHIIVGNRDIDELYGGRGDIAQYLSLFTYWGISVGLWWGVLYLGFWVARGFVDDDDKKAGF